MPELRYERVTRTWVVIATERAKRPSDFISEQVPKREKQECPFCPGNEAETPPEVMAYRDENTRPNTPGWRVRVVPNKFPALDRNTGLSTRRRDFFHSLEAAGVHEVIIESPNHQDGFGVQKPEEILTALRAWQERYTELAYEKGIIYTQIFKNHGAVAGASLEHPHSQLIATPVVPSTVENRLASTQSYYQESGRCFYCDLLEAEEREGVRTVYRDEHVLAFCPFASRFPLEVWLLPRRHQETFLQATRAQLSALAQALHLVCRRLREGMKDPPFNLILNSAPYRGGDWRASFHWYLELLPRLSIIAGFELGTGMFINPLPPEVAAEFYRA
jgi:UDPglucose--hexose-1-phosphate uridylyltransferase